jgi:hypothetical protein
MPYVILLFLMAVLGLYAVQLGRGKIDVPASLAELPWVKRGGVGLFLASVILSVVWFCLPEPNPFAAAKAAVVNGITDVVVGAMNNGHRYPVPIDNTLTLRNLEARYGHIVYTIGVSTMSSSDFNAIVEKTRADIMANGCNRSEYQTLLKIGMTVEIDYIAASGYGAEPIILSPSSCSNP